MMGFITYDFLRQTISSDYDLMTLSRFFLFLSVFSFNPVLTESNS